MKPLKDDASKLEVISLSYGGLSHRDISEITGVPKSTITDFLAKLTYKTWWDQNEKEIEEKFSLPNAGPKIYFIDIETSPLVAYVWGLYDQNISHNHIIEDWEILCVCYKKLGTEEIVRLSSAGEYLHIDKLKAGALPDEQIKAIGGLMSHQELANKLWEVLDDADIIVAHNGIRFDNKKIRAKLKLAGLQPPSPYKVIDTLKICKYNFGFTSNRKDYLSKKLGGDGKQDTGGMRLWIDCMSGDLNAWRSMLDYCTGDVEELERIYYEVRAWDNRHPNLQLYYKDAHLRCGTCSGLRLVPVDHKTATTSTSAYELLRCEDCGATKRRRRNIRSKEQMTNTLVNVS